MKTYFRGLLKKELEILQAKNPRFSIRSFARKLGLAPSTLHQYLSGRYIPSSENLEKIASRLNWESRVVQEIKDELSRTTLSDESPLLFEEDASPEARAEIMNALDFLRLKGVLEEDRGRWRVRKSICIVSPKTPTGPFLEFQKDSLRRFEEALTGVEKADRLALMANLVLRKEDLETIAKEMNRFARDLKKRFHSTSSTNTYQLICGLIPK